MSDLTPQYVLNGGFDEYQVDYNQTKFDILDDWFAFVPKYWFGENWLGPDGNTYSDEFWGFWRVFQAAHLWAKFCFPDAGLIETKETFATGVVQVAFDRGTLA